MRERRMTRSAAVVALAAALLCGTMGVGWGADTGARRTVAPDTPVDLNTATAEGLTAVPGIGKVMAERIVQWREEHGPFRRVEDLLKVKGVGEKTLERLRPYLKVGKSR